MPKKGYQGGLLYGERECPTIQRVLDVMNYQWSCCMQFGVFVGVFNGQDI